MRLGMRSKTTLGLVAAALVTLLGGVASATWYGPYSVIVPSFGGNTTTQYEPAQGIYQAIATSTVGGSYSGDLNANITSNGTNHLATTDQPIYSNSTAYFTSSTVTNGEYISPLWWTDWWIPVNVQTTGSWETY